MAIRTPRLILRTLTLADASRLALLAGDYDVASMTGTIPHPYSEEMAAEWIVSVLAGEEGVVFAIERSGALIGCTGYRAFGPDHADSTRRSPPRVTTSFAIATGSRAIPRP